MKAYIITSPCAGKTRIANRLPNYCGITILDHNNLMATMFDQGTISVQSSELDKAEVLLSYLESLEFPACILGAYMPDDPANYPNIRFIGVVLPKPIHYLYTTKRRIRSTLARVHDGVPVLKSLEPTDRWDMWVNTAKHREKVISYVAKHKLPLFASIQNALDSLKLHQIDNQENNRPAI
jgi:hypothetical protein